MSLTFKFEFDSQMKKVLLALFMMKLFWSPWAPALQGKRIAGSITSGYLDGGRAEPRMLRCLSYMLQASFGYCVASHDSDYPRPLARQCSKGNYRWLRRYTRQGLHVAWGPLAC